MNDMRAAVALVYVESTHEFLVVRRAAHPKDPWSYQMALPGGKRENRESLIETAQRETMEECQIALNQPVASLKPQIAGKYALYTIKVQPYLFILKDKPKIILDQRELSAYFWVNCDHFQDPDNHSYKVMSKNHPNLKFPVYKIAENYIWGFTYSVLVKHFNQNPLHCLSYQMSFIEDLENIR